MALLALAAVGIALAPATAFGADPTTHQYGSALDQLSQGGTGGGTGSGSLPFTGMDIALLAAAAAALMVAGLLLRRRAPRAAEAGS